MPQAITNQGELVNPATIRAPIRTTCTAGEHEVVDERALRAVDAERERPPKILGEEHGEDGAQGQQRSADPGDPGQHQRQPHGADHRTEHQPQGELRGQGAAEVDRGCPSRTR